MAGASLKSIEDALDRAPCVTIREAPVRLQLNRVPIPPKWIGDAVARGVKSPVVNQPQRSMVAGADDYE